jgi:hypothetical protein
MENVLNTVLGVVLGTIATVVFTWWQGNSRRRAREREEVEELVKEVPLRQAFDEHYQEREDVRYVTLSILDFRDWIKRIMRRARNQRGYDILKTMMQACNDYLKAQQHDFDVDKAPASSKEQTIFMQALDVIRPKIHDGANELRKVYRIPE